MSRASTPRTPSRAQNTSIPIGLPVPNDSATTETTSAPPKATVPHSSCSIRNSSTVRSSPAPRQPPADRVRPAEQSLQPLRTRPQRRPEQPQDRGERRTRIRHSHEHLGPAEIPQVRRDPLVGRRPAQGRQTPYDDQQAGTEQRSDETARQQRTHRNTRSGSGNRPIRNINRYATTHTTAPAPMISAPIAEL